MKDEYLTRCVVSIVKRKIYLYSSGGSEREVSCDSTEEFMNMLEFVRKTLDENTLHYSEI